MNEIDSDTSPMAVFEDNVELLSEKRGSTREDAYVVINRYLRMNFSSEELEKRKITLLEAIKRGMKKGSVKEQQLSANTLALLSVTLGMESEEIFKELFPLFEELIAKPPHIESLPDIINSFAMLSFVGCTDEAITLKTLELLSSTFINQESGPVREAALDAWGFLLTTIPKTYIFDHILPENITPIVDLLRHADVEVRLAASQCVALLFEAARATEENFDLHSFGNDYDIDVDDMLDVLYGLADSKVRAKKDKAKQRLPFKDIKNYIESGEVPVERLTFKHHRFDFDNWSQLIQLSAFRDVLGEGLQTHFESNELLQEIFGVIIDKNAKKTHLSAIEKRMFMSPSSPMKKASTKTMNKQRRNKSDVHAALNLSDE